MKIECPRLAGVREHLSRAQLYRRLAIGLTSEDAYRLEMAAIYSCCALADIMVTAAEKQEVRGFEHTDEMQSKQDFKAHIGPKLAYYELVARIRIHDFHRFGIRPPSETTLEEFYGGSVRMIAPPGGMVRMTLTPTGPLVEASGGGRVKADRPLLQRDGKFYDDMSGQFLTLERLLSAFLSTAAEVLVEFEALLSLSPPPLD